MKKNLFDYLLSPLSLFFDQPIAINKIEKEEAYFHKLKNLEIEQSVMVNTLKPQAVVVHDESLHPALKEKCKKYPLNLNIVKIFNLTKIFLESIKWCCKTMNLQTVVRNYNVKIQKNALSLKLSPNDLVISRKLRITEEIIGLEPYTRKLSAKKLINYPVTKTPASKAEFSKNEIEFFREKLALQANTTKFNVNVLNIYEKFILGIFSSIKQDEKTSNIFCYFDPQNKQISENDLYYFVIGIRKDNNQLVKTLVKPQELKKATA